MKNLLWPTFGTLEKINSLNVVILLNFLVQDFEKDVCIRTKLYYQIYIYIYFKCPALYSCKTDSLLRILGVWKRAIFGLEFRHLL